MSIFEIIKNAKHFISLNVIVNFIKNYLQEIIAIFSSTHTKILHVSISTYITSLETTDYL